MQNLKNNQKNNPNETIRMTRGANFQFQEGNFDQESCKVKSSLKINPEESQEENSTQIIPTYKTQRERMKGK